MPHEPLEFKTHQDAIAYARRSVNASRVVLGQRPFSDADFEDSARASEVAEQSASLDSLDSIADSLQRIAITADIIHGAIAAVGMKFYPEGFTESVRQGALAEIQRIARETINSSAS